VGIFRKGSLGVVGRMIGLAATYALLINLILAGFLGAQTVMAAGHGEAGFELCLSGQDGAQPSGGAAGHVTKVHCVLCVVGGSLADTSISALAVAIAFEASPVMSTPAGADAGYTSVDHRSTSPRGPPKQA
jgi:hypothetical protein